MDSNTIGAGGIAMMNLNQRVSVNRAIHPTGMLIVVAILLIVVGLALQWNCLRNGRLCRQHRTRQAEKQRTSDDGGKSSFRHI